MSTGLQPLPIGGGETGRPLRVLPVVLRQQGFADDLPFTAEAFHVAVSAGGRVVEGREAPLLQQTGRAPHGVQGLLPARVQGAAVVLRLSGQFRAVDGLEGLREGSGDPSVLMAQKADPRERRAVSAAVVEQSVGRQLKSADEP